MRRSAGFAVSPGKDPTQLYSLAPTVSLAPLSVTWTHTRSWASWLKTRSRLLSSNVPAERQAEAAVTLAELLDERLRRKSYPGRRLQWSRHPCLPWQTLD